MNLGVMFVPFSEGAGREGKLPMPVAGLAKGCTTWRWVLFHECGRIDNCDMSMNQLEGGLSEILVA